MEVGAILKGPRGGELVVADMTEHGVYVHSRRGWNTIARWLKNPRSYVRVCPKFVQMPAVREGGRGYFADCRLLYGHAGTCEPKAE